MDLKKSMYKLGRIRFGNNLLLRHNKCTNSLLLLSKNSGLNNSKVLILNKYKLDMNNLDTNRFLHIGKCTSFPLRLYRKFHRNNYILLLSYMLDMLNWNNIHNHQSPNTIAHSRQYTLLLYNNSTD